MMDETAKQAAQVAIPIIAIGIIIAVAIQSNLALKFSTQLIQISGGTLLASMLFIILGCIIMGMGLPTVAAYIIGAVLFVPALRKLGIPELASHMFVMYYCVLSMITPPVALASYTAAGIAGANSWKTGWFAFRLSWCCSSFPSPSPSTTRSSGVARWSGFSSPLPRCCWRPSPGRFSSRATCTGRSRSPNAGCSARLPSPSSSHRRALSGGGRERRRGGAHNMVFHRPGAGAGGSESGQVVMGRRDEPRGVMSQTLRAPQLRYYIPLAAIPGRRPTDGTEPYLRPEVGFNPNWFHVRCGVDFSERWHEDPAYRLETLRIMAAEIRRRFPDHPIGGVTEGQEPRTS